MIHGESERELVERYGQAWLDAPEYMDTAEAIRTRAAYDDFVRQCEAQFSQLPVAVSFEDVNPYKSCAAMVRAVAEAGVLRIWHTQPDQPHAYLSDRENDIFRAVHDYYGHILSGGDFSIDGEMAAYRRHLTMFTGPAREVLAAETAGQLGAYVLTGDFQKQKAVCIPVL